MSSVRSKMRVAASEMYSGSPPGWVTRLFLSVKVAAPG